MDFNTLLAVKDLMSSDIITVSSSVSVMEAAKLMTDKKITSVLLTDEKDIISGIVTETDMVHKVIATGADSATTPSADIMNPDVHQIAGDTSIFEARKVMTDLGVKHLVVVEDGKPIGLISSTALLG